MLRSRRLGREVIPRLTQRPQLRRSGWASTASSGSCSARACAGAWRGAGAPLAKAPFLPRVVYGRAGAVAGALDVRQRELEALGAERRAWSASRPCSACATRRRLPRWVALADGDNELPIDLDNVAERGHARRTWCGAAPRACVLVELFPGPDELCVRGPGGPLRPRAGGALRAAASGPSDPGASGQPRSVPRAARARRSPPARSGCTRSSTPARPRRIALLRDDARRGRCGRLGPGAADRWFFIRYGDPDWHLRLRLHGEPRACTPRCCRRCTRPARARSSAGEAWHAAAGHLRARGGALRRPGGRGAAGAALPRRQRGRARAARALSRGTRARTCAGAWRCAAWTCCWTTWAWTARAKLAVAERSRESFGREFRATGAFSTSLGPASGRRARGSTRRGLRTAAVTTCWRRGWRCCVSGRRAIARSDAGWRRRGRRDG